METKRLAEIRARCDAATPGPWEAYEKSRDGEMCGLRGISDFDDVWSRGVLHDGEFRLNTEYAARECFRIPDADLMAHSRQDIPDLLAYIDYLEDELLSAAG